MRVRLLWGARRGLLPLSRKGGKVEGGGVSDGVRRVTGM